ncbi:hypothetical protein TP70_08645 [Staphylococcus microti]|uniref:Membrane protein n=1 Tax=Staphylococcus microti TaxID=569857 RepID=A0A0D6XP89_9STAP|nr:DUF3169 family protein [Staphylococcus microti]KIX90240.1 hypothetical protein TP70_08645 [Staphylococcus microti]PNZ79657.1 DUF3169 domain-containing protein [Staphylococcus microti]SUM56534.1 membrane protein [Staphylococcus microti]
MKVMRYILLLLVGGIIGGVIGTIIGVTNGFDVINKIHFVNDRTAMIMGIIAILGIILLFVYNLMIQKQALHYKKMMDEQVSDSETDLREKKASLIVLRITMVSYLQLFISLILLLVFVIGHATESHFLYVVIAFILASVGSTQYGLFIRKYDARYPKMGEKQYTEKLLALMDDGERHITLVSMYKVYTINTMLLIIAIMLLGIMSIGTGMNHTLSIIVLLIILSYNVFGYHFKVRKFYK